MTETPARYEMSALAVLPFRAQLNPGTVEVALPPGGDLSRFEISYPATIPLAPDGGYTIATQLCTTVAVAFKKAFTGDPEAYGRWLEGNSAAVVRDDVLPRINRLFLAIKALAPNAFSSATIRNIGELDLVLVNLFWEEKVVLSRATATIIGPGEGALAIPGPALLARGVSVVRSRMMRAVDLVHHGYPSEAVLVAFSLLDLQVQDFIAARLPNLSLDAGHDLVRRIERRRLSTYLGSLMRICVGESPLDSANMPAKLQRLNRLRNDAIHRAVEITTREAQEALSTTHSLLKFMDDRGARFDLAEHLDFWTP